MLCVPSWLLIFSCFTFKWKCSHFEDKKNLDVSKPSLHLFFFIFTIKSIDLIHILNWIERIWLLHVAWSQMLDWEMLCSTILTIGFSQLFSTWVYFNIESITCLRISIEWTRLHISIWLSSYPISQFRPFRPKLDSFEPSWFCVNQNPCNVSQYIRKFS